MSEHEGRDTLDQERLGEDRLGPAADLFYADLMAAHHGLTLEQSARLDARLVLILANLVGELSVLKTAIAAAREGVSDE